MAGAVVADVVAVITNISQTKTTVIFPKNNNTPYNT
jgi:hypothetical protein